MAALKSFLEGKKTYIVAAAMIAYQALGYFLNGTPFDVQAILAALGIAALRAGVSK